MYNLLTKNKVGEGLKLASKLLWYGWVNDGFEIVTNLGGFKWMGEERPKRVWTWEEEEEVEEVVYGGEVRYVFRGGLKVVREKVVCEVECERFVHVKGEFLAVSEGRGIRMIKASNSGSVLKSDLVKVDFEVKGMARFSNYVLAVGVNEGVVFEVTRKMEFRRAGEFEVKSKGICVNACQRAEEGFWLVVEKEGGGDGGFMKVTISQEGG
ncbi:hypothetical protein TrST_g5072 [Triparma strigata]|uniref:Uncharacterized protein n=1 Tax=Triparma strigata TaxID=1606541 RepID=A0A9W7EGX2_9STRA|nr:hypothetical protein TrST_g5072 [Triparma strigata]